jgi:hypothetical protein
MTGALAQRFDIADERRGRMFFRGDACFKLGSCRIWHLVPLRVEFDSTRHRVVKQVRNLPKRRPTGWIDTSIIPAKPIWRELRAAHEANAHPIDDALSFAPLGRRPPDQMLRTISRPTRTLSSSDPVQQTRNLLIRFPAGRVEMAAIASQWDGVFAEGEGPAISNTMGCRG